KLQVELNYSVLLMELRTSATGLRKGMFLNGLAMN
ncbi:hypothetical protein GCK32_000990, partial [Trichostrongylus colubriformis]